MNIQNGTMRSLREYDKTVESIAAVWMGNVKIDQSNESWIEICRRSPRIESSPAEAEVSVEHDWNLCTNPG
jgi:hypothetical protein